MSHQHTHTHTHSNPIHSRRREMQFAYMDSSEEKKKIDRKFVNHIAWKTSQQIAFLIRLWVYGICFNFFLDMSSACMSNWRLLNPWGEFIIIQHCWDASKMTGTKWRKKNCNSFKLVTTTTTTTTMTIQQLSPMPTQRNANEQNKLCTQRKYCSRRCLLKTISPISIAMCMLLSHAAALFSFSLPRCLSFAEFDLKQRNYGNLLYTNRAWLPKMRDFWVNWRFSSTKLLAASVQCTDRCNFARHAFSI